MNEIISQARAAVEAAIGSVHIEEGSYTPVPEAEATAIIDHTLLKADASPEAIDTLCAEAKTHNFFSVCVNPVYVSRAAKNLAGSQVKVCTVIGFPLGASTKETKAFEAHDAVEKGAHEVDTVIPVGLLKAGELQAVYEDIKAVVEAVGDRALTKVIIETALLTDHEKAIASLLSVAAGADFVKTSTGFSTGGATPEDVRLMRAAVGPSIGVKASGGVRSLEDAVNVMQAGANRIGCSAGVSIAEGRSSTSSY
ncbi:deoxyribose-phosphate aldolase [Tumebacillus algifaecis]|uniref:Deoxyribose-phosphate aldolase n=1 Tax=Tumebacillus algifaecis TaxID=1214604 RepID=A0A223D3W4_9BACL|nr:deoxyribose-phosphate aldolase [Tumebacillus algifaecis]ASS76096.1 deoxyribose-phosphate aldolase [Tumebacillus algifaecis]